MIDLRSDTVTEPDEAMREAARDAAVGDDVYGEDPTVNDLEATVADRLGTADALFCPTGTMANQVAVRTHTERGQEVLVEREAHVYKWEVGGLADLAALQVRPLDGGPRGVPTAEQVHGGHVAEDVHRPGTGLLCLENTHNSRGGVAIEPERLRAAADAAREHDTPVHLDGARLFNAAVALDAPVTAFTEHADSVMVSLSKGLGAPVGSVLAGSEAFVERARRNRKLYGGGMRQAGVVAAPALEALAPANVERLATDHENARLLADGLDDVAGLSAPAPETNVVLAETERPAVEVLARCEEAGVAGVQFDDHVARFCTHRDVDRSAVQEAVERVATALAE